MSIIQDADGQLILIVRSIKLHKFRFYVGFEAKGYKFWLLDIGSVRYFLVSGSSSSLVTGDLVQLQLYAPPLPGLVRHSRYQGEQKYALIYVNLTLSVTIVLIWGAFFSMKYWFLNPELLSSVYFKTPFWMSSVLCAWDPTVVATAFLPHISPIWHISQIWHKN